LLVVYNFIFYRSIGGGSTDKTVLMTSQWLVSTHTPSGEIVFNIRGIFSLFNTLNVQGGLLNRALFKNFLDQARLYQSVCISSPDKG
jgi:hypothetical protein